MGLQTLASKTAVPATEPVKQRTGALEADTGEEFFHSRVGYSLAAVPTFAAGSPDENADAWQRNGAYKSGPRLNLQAKLMVGAVNDPLEAEADRVADQVMRMPESESASQADHAKPTRNADHGNQAGATLQRKCDCGGSCDDCQQKHEDDQHAKVQMKASGVAPAHGMEAPPIVHEVLRSPGKPLDSETRAFMEPRFGHDFSKVRIHTDAKAAESAKAVGAKAYTVGSSVVFGSGEFGPWSHAGQNLLGHELAHVMQQDGSGIGPGGRTLRRQPSPPASSSTWNDLLRDFNLAKISRSAQDATVIAKQLVDSNKSFDDLMEHGAEVIQWLEDHGERETAIRFLGEVRSAFAIRSAVEKPELPDPSIRTSDDNKRYRKAALPGSEMFSVNPVLAGPFNLIDMGKKAARLGLDDDAFQFFGAAQEILSFYAMQFTEQRDLEIDSRPGAYGNLNSVYNSMREIYGFYNELEQEAISSGDTKLADRERSKAAELISNLNADSSLKEQQVETIEGTPTGDKLVVEGINRATTPLEKLPGLQKPEELNSNVKREPLQEVQHTLAAQAQLMAAIKREPEIQKRFGNQSIDLTQTDQRQVVWGIMYKSYQQSGEGALAALMNLIGRYLKAYTVHTTFNIRDFGLNYIDSIFPIDIANRLEADCGVYALTVAWDVFKTVQTSGPKVNIKFRIGVSLDHVTLLIDDQGTGETYLLNNDQITRINQFVPPAESTLRPFFRTSPRRKDVSPFDDDSDQLQPYVSPEEEVEKEYSSMRGLPFLATPFFFFDLGSSKDPATAFKANLWKQYLKGTGQISSKEAPLNKELHDQKLGGVHDVQRSFAENAGILNNMMDQLRPLASDVGSLTSQLDSDMPLAMQVLGLFTKFEKSFAPFDKTHQFVARYPDSGHGHPLVRVALAILRVRKLGGQLSFQVQTHSHGKVKMLTADDFVQSVEQLFPPEMAKFRDAGLEGDF